jgi:superfamily II DNA or RNA helicase
MPTGSGKTRTAMNVIANHLRSTEPTVVIWLASSEELCDQAAEEFNEAWSVLGDRPVTLKKFWGSHKLNLDGFNDGILIAGLPKLIRLADHDFTKIGLLGTIASLIVLDEAHQAIARRYKHAIEALLAHHADSALIGLSATPGRTWNDVTADEQLAIFFSRRKVNLQIPGYSNPVEYLVEKGYLAKASFSTLLYKSGLKLTDDDLKRLQNALDVPDHILETLAEDEKRNLSIITKVEEMIKRHKRIIVFASSVAHAHLITNVLHARGHEASAITTRTPAQDRTRSIDVFKSDKPSTIVLCNYGVLTTGFDAPQTSCAIIARPTKSLVLYSQMVGRAIRGPKAKGNEQADIVTVIDQHLPGFGGVADAFSNWEDIWTIPT